MKPGLMKVGIAALIVAGCTPMDVPDVAQLMEPEPVKTHASLPPGADPEACHGQDVTPAIIETVTEQVMLQPAQIASDGTVLYPAVYKTETQQAIVQERRELWFETPCNSELTVEFVSSLQRALKVRGVYRGPINGEMSPRTRRAIRAYQKPQGLDSAILSTAAARQLGLVAFGEVPDPITPPVLITSPSPETIEAEPETERPSPRPGIRPLNRS